VSSTQAPTVADIDRITAISDPVVRNLQITQCYAELSAVMALRTGPSANWCTFATWASKQAGQTIRQEDLVRRFRQLLADTPAVNEAAAEVAADVSMSAEQAGAAREARQVEATLWDVLDPKAPFKRAGDAVARGNRKVFEEIAREFARFYAGCFADGSYSAANIDQFCSELRAGDPPDGQQYLRRAFTCYYGALFEADAKRRAELLLLANIQIGYHEQTRLQPEILAALDAPVIDPRQLADRLLKALFPYPTWATRLWLRYRQWRGRPLLMDIAMDRFVARVRYLAHLVVTEHMMTIGLPEGNYLRLGRDLRADYPPSLVRLANEDLLRLLALVDPTTDSVDATGALDWGRLTDRLHFIVDMFRCYQEWLLLFDPPFTAAQAEAIKRGQRPQGEV
jgi:hypothetical protein